MIRKEIETILAQTTPLSGRARDNTFDALLKMAVKRRDKVFTIFAINILSDQGKYPPELIEFAENPIVYENKWVLPFSWVESTPIVESTQNRNWLKHLALARKGRENTQPVNQGWDHW
jgi:hypothetical protein